MKKMVSFLLGLVLMMSASSPAFADSEAAERGLEAIRATRWADALVLPKEESYLSEWKTLYARKAFKAPCLRVERITKVKTGRKVMPNIS